MGGGGEGAVRGAYGQYQHLTSCFSRKTMLHAMQREEREVGGGGGGAWGVV